MQDCNFEIFYDPIDENDFWKEISWQGQDGIRLHGRLYNAHLDTSHLVLCLPGLSRNSKDFHWLARRIQHRPVLAVDYRGRGRSDYADPATYTPFHELSDILEILKKLGTTKTDIIGTSRGGLIAMFMAASNPELIKSVTLNDIGPKIELSGLLKIKDYIGVAKSFPSWDDALVDAHIYDEFFPAWSKSDWWYHVRSTYKEKNGQPALDYDPNLALGLETVTPETEIPTLWPQFAALAPIPTLLLHGELSLLISRETVEEMKKAHEQMKVVTVNGQGHVPILTHGKHVNGIMNFLDV